MHHYLVHWLLEGGDEVISGKDFNDAFVRAGYDLTELMYVSFYETLD